MFKLFRVNRIFNGSYEVFVAPLEIAPIVNGFDELYSQECSMCAAFGGFLRCYYRICLILKTNDVQISSNF